MADAEKVTYYENEKKKKSLGIIYLDEIEEVNAEENQKSLSGWFSSSCWFLTLP